MQIKISLAVAVVALTAGAQEILCVKDKGLGVNALPASENRWQAKVVYAESLTPESYRSLVNLDFFALEYGTGFPETPFDTTGTNTFRKVFGYSPKEGGAGVRFGRGWGPYLMSQYAVDIDIEQSGDTEWQLVYNKPSNCREGRKFAVKGSGRVKRTQVLGKCAHPVGNTEISGVEVVCVTKGVKGVIHSLRIAPHVVPLAWRRRFSLPCDPVRAGLSIYCAPNCSLRVNGRNIANGHEFCGHTVRKFDLTKYLNAGLNEVSYACEAAGGWESGAKLYAELFAVADDGTVTRFDTDERWEFSFDGETWKAPRVGERAGFASNAEGLYATGEMPLHAGALDVRPEDPNGYPVFDFNRPIRWRANAPAGVKDGVVTAVARQILDAAGKLVAISNAQEFAGEERGSAIAFENIPVGAYEIEWTLASGGRVVDSLKNEMVVCGPIDQTVVAYEDFERTLTERQKVVQSVDCAQEEKDETKFLDHSGPFGKPELNVGKVVDLGGGIRARETGLTEQSYFAYKLEVGRLGAPHILEADVPDVREQTLYCWINESYPVNFCNNAFPVGSQSWPNATGSLTCGGIMPLSGKVKKLRIVFFPGSRNITVCFERGKRGGPAAVCGFRVYEIEGGLPALQVPKTDRRYGNHNERPVFAAWGAYVDPAMRCEQCGVKPRGWTAAFAAALNRTAFLRYCGHNASIEGAYMYTGIFPTESGESVQTTGEFDFRYPMIKLYAHNGIHTYLGYEYMRSPALIKKGCLDVSDREVQAGTARTIYEVNKHGRQHVGYMGNGLNFLNPDVRTSMKNVLGEIYNRYASAADIEGLVVFNGGWWLPGIVTGSGDSAEDVSYDDDTIELFEVETGIRLGCGWSGKERFMKRYKLLNGKYAKAWYDWRAKKLRESVEELEKVVTSGARKWKVYPTGSYTVEEVNPFVRLGGTPEIRAGYETGRRRVSGFPVELYGEGSGSKISMLPIGTFGREVYLSNYGTLFNPGSAEIRWKNDAAYYHCGSLDEHTQTCKAAKKWWWRNNGVCVYDVKQCGEKAFFDLTETVAAYAPRLLFHTWLDVNVTSAHAEECRRFVTGFYATPHDRHPVDVPSVKGIQARRYGNAIQLVNATPWGVNGWLRAGSLTKERIEIPPYGIVVRGEGCFFLPTDGEFTMDGDCPYSDFESARNAMSYERMRMVSCRTSTEKGRANQNRFLADLAKDGVARIDAGANTDTYDSAGVHWLPDQPYGGSDTYGNEFVMSVNRGEIAIDNTKAPEVYRTEAGGGSPLIVYHFPVPKGAYRLVCHVAETWDRLPGRLMNVTVNGVRRRVDVWNLCGGRMRAGQFEFDDIVVPEKGEILFEATDNPIISAFEIIRK